MLDIFSMALGFFKFSKYQLIPDSGPADKSLNKTPLFQYAQCIRDRGARQGGIFDDYSPLQPNLGAFFKAIEYSSRSS